MWIYTLITTVLGVLGFLLGLWNLWRSHRQPIRDLQFERRKNFAQILEVFKDQVARVDAKARRGGFPDSQSTNDLKVANRKFRDISNKLVVPTQKQTLALAGRIAAVTDAIDRRTTDVDDSVFTDPVPAEILTALEDLRRDIDYTLEGLWKIEQGKTLRYKAQFTRLTG
ncbi:hypothetical protein [Mycolicibacterium sp. S3B2]|uniref:hypothetical protein n=1 Tax=Mycolicibacterium sp. S3B2 TaxID=3415120 RepID=UPI003C7B1BF4